MIRDQVDELDEFLYPGCYIIEDDEDFLETLNDEQITLGAQLKPCKFCDFE